MKRFEVRAYIEAVYEIEAESKEEAKHKGEFRMLQSLHSKGWEVRSTVRRVR